MKEDRTNGEDMQRGRNENWIVKKHENQQSSDTGKLQSGEKQEKFVSHPVVQDSIMQDGKYRNILQNYASILYAGNRKASNFLLSQNLCQNFH